MQQEISLYLDLEENGKVELEVMARTSLAFAGLVREIAFILDPVSGIRLEFDSGTPGSLSLNSIISSIKENVSDKITIKYIAIAVLLFFAKELPEAILANKISELFGSDTTLTDRDAELIAVKIENLRQKRIGLRFAQDVYKELEKDPNITSVGISLKKGSRPLSPVPRDEFRIRAGDFPEIPEPLKTRTRTQLMLLSLISPVLSDADNKWRFQGEDGIFSAGMKDQKFLSKLLSGETGIIMRSGIQILAYVDITEHEEDAVWHIDHRNVSEVIDVRTDNFMGELFSDQKNGTNN